MPYNIQVKSVNQGSEAYIAARFTVYSSSFLRIMTFEEFQQSISLSAPPKGLSPILEALWHDANGDWEAAHNIAQSKEGTQTYDRLHAYLHRVEGDTFNAGYWYRRAGSEVFKGSLKEEWAYLTHIFIQKA